MICTTATLRFSECKHDRFLLVDGSDYFMLQRSDAACRLMTPFKKFE